MTRRIVAAIDDSPLSVDVIAWALRNAQPGDRVDALLVWNVSLYRGLENPFANLDEAARHHADVARHLLADAERAVGAIDQEVRTGIDVRHGDPAQELTRAAETATLLVIGNHRRRSLGKVGSVASAILDAAPCPVVVVPPSESGHTAASSDRPVDARS